MADAASIEEQKQRVRKWAEGLAAVSGLALTVRVAREEPEGILIAFEGEDAGLLIGRGGAGLDALQVLATHALGGRGGARLHVLFDADGYRARRENVLIHLAQELADQVKATGQEAVLDPLSAYERRIVHHALLEISGVRTYSEGEEPERYIVIAPAGG